MVAQRKIFAVENLKEKIKQAKGLILTDYSGLNVNQINQLRGEIKKTGGEFEVVKNTLLSLAAKNSQFQMENLKLEGPTAALWVYQEDFSPFKILNNFIKQTSLPKIKFGFWQKELLSPERIQEIANLPGKTELQSKLIVYLYSPLFKLASVLNWNLLKLVLILKTREVKINGGK